MTTTFADEAERVGADYRRALAAVLGAGPEGIEPAAVAERFGVDTTLAWKLSRQVSAPNGLDVFRHMPGPSALRGLSGRAGDAGLPREAIAAFGLAVDAYQDLVRRHAGSRRAFDVLVAGQLAGRAGDEPETRLELDLRRAGFESSAFVQGVKVHTHFAAMVLAPADGWINLTVLRGAMGLQRLRPSAMWRVSHTTKMVRPGTPAPGSTTDVVMRPIDPDWSGDGLPLVSAFSTCTNDEFRQTEASDELVEYALRPGEVGDEAAMDVVFGERIDRARPVSAAEAGMRELTHIGGIKTPCERVVYDALVHESLFESAVPTVDAYSTIFARPGVAISETDALPLRPIIEQRGRGLDGLALSGCPRHVALLRYALAQTGVEESSLIASRIVIAFPPVPMTLKLVWVRPA
ncbi:MAG: hypothetical protein AAFR76_13130 [Planctomycetota bacterium]